MRIFYSIPVIMDEGVWTGLDDLVGWSLRMIVICNLSSMLDAANSPAVLVQRITGVFGGFIPQHSRDFLPDNQL